MTGASIEHAVEKVAVRLHREECDPSYGKPPFDASGFGMGDQCGRWLSHRHDAREVLDVSSFSSQLDWPLNVNVLTTSIGCGRCDGIVASLPDDGPLPLTTRDLGDAVDRHLTDCPALKDPRA